MQPRALWLAARHVPLRAALDGQWAALLKALTDALSGNEEAVRRRRSSSCHTCAQGLGGTAACNHHIDCMPAVSGGSTMQSTPCLGIASSHTNSLRGRVRNVEWLHAGRQSAATMLLCCHWKLSEIILLAASCRLPSPVESTLNQLAFVLGMGVMHCRQKMMRAAGAEGCMGTPQAAAPSRGALDPFGVPPTDEASVNAEATDVGLLTMEFLAALVAANVGAVANPNQKVHECGVLGTLWVGAMRPWR